MGIDMIGLFNRPAILAGFALAAVIASFALFVIQSPAGIEPLTSSQDFLNASNFLQFWPDPARDFLTDKTTARATFLTNLRLNHGEWSPFSGLVETGSFEPSPFMMVPLIGPKYTDDSPRFKPHDASVALVCIADGRTRELLQAPAKDWFERVFAVPTNWCRGPVRISATAFTNGVEFGVGTPFRVNLLYWIASGTVGKCAAAFIAFVFVSLFIVPFLLVRQWSTLTRSAVSLLYLSGCGYVTYQVGYAGMSQLVMRLLLALQIFTPTVFTILVHRRSGAQPDFGALRCWLEGNFIIIGMVLFAYVVLPAANGAWFPNHAFDPAGWSTDNQLPAMMAKFLQLHGAGRPPYLAAWSITDRGVAPAGMVANFIIFLKLIGIYVDNPIVYVFFHFFQSIAQGAITSLFLIILRNEGWTVRRRTMFLAVCMMTPFVFFNVFYVWPKLIAGGLGILSMLLFADGLRHWRPINFFLAILCFGMAMLCHSASLLAAPAIVVFIIIAILQRVRSAEAGGWLPAQQVGPQILGAILLGTIFAVGALALQDRLAPKTSYATTFLLTGLGVFDLNHQQVENMVTAFYHGLSWHQWIEMKLGAFETLFWLSGNSYTASFCVANSNLSCLRAAEFFCLLPALGIAPLLLVVRDILKRLQRSKSDVLHLESDVIYDMRRFAIICFAFVLIFIFPFNAPMLVHQMPYILVLGILAGSLTLIRQEPDSLANIAVLLQMFNLAFVWFFGAWITWHFLLGA